MADPSPAKTAFEQALIASLETDGGYRVLKRVQPLAPVSTEDGAAVAIAIDLETTGLDPVSDEVVEIGMVRLRYDMRSCRILGIEGVFEGMREPTVPVPAEICRLTGIDPRELVGRSIDKVDVAQFVEGACIVVAFNSAFDRKFAERAWPEVFVRLPWCCAYTGIDWTALGFERGRLSHLVLQSGFFHEGHRAVDDVFAMLHLLSLEVRPQPFRTLIEAARNPSARVWAERAPYASKSRLKQRGYLWSDGARGAPRAWYREVPSADVTAEVAFLREDPDTEPRVVPVTAFDRFSERAGLQASEWK